MMSVEKKLDTLAQEARKEKAPQPDVRDAVRYRIHQLVTPVDHTIQWMAWGAVAVALIMMASILPYVSDVLDPMGPMIYQAYSDGFQE